jgi:hypothetical protein
MALQYAPGDAVLVRSAAPTWWPGVVATVDPVKIVVNLDAPVPNGNQWAGKTLPYGGTSPVNKVTIWVAAETAEPGSHIQPVLQQA